MCLFIAPLPALRSWQWREEADLLVVAHRLDGVARAARNLSDRVAHDRLLNLQWL